MQDWFTVDQIDADIFCISEYGHWEETHCYLLNGTECSLLIDTGLGVGNISQVVRRLTSRPVIAAATHIHWDHIGGHRYFPVFFAHEAETIWLQGRFPLPLQVVRNMVLDCSCLPDGFSVEEYEIFQGVPDRLLSDGDQISLGNRQIRVLHTPGHSPGHLCFWEAERQYLFSGDLAYRGTLYANYPSTDPDAYLESLERMAQLPVKRLFPGHHDLNISPEFLIELRDSFRELKERDRLRHGGGRYEYDGWSLLL